MSQFSDAIGAIYDSALDPAQWHRALDAIRVFVNSRTVVLQSYDILDQNVPWNLTVGYEPIWLQALNDGYQQENPLMPIIAGWATGEAGYASAHPIWPQLVETSFYTNWARPQGLVDIAGVVVDKTMTTIGTLVVVRGDEHGLCDDRIAVDLTMLFPHVRRAMLIGRTIGHLRDEATDLADVLDRLSAGVILLSASGAVVRANVAGKKMLGHGLPVQVRSGVLTLPTMSAQRALQRALATVTNGDAAAGDQGVSIPIEGSDAAAFVAHVLPLNVERRKTIAADAQAAAILFIRPKASGHAAAVAALARSHNLTEREQEVVQALVDIGGIPMVADILGISQTTVRTHVTNIFDKTGVRRQADLIKLLMETGVSPH